MDLPQPETKQPQGHSLSLSQQDGGESLESKS